MRKRLPFLVQELIIIFLLALQCSGCGAVLEDYNYNPLGSSYPTSSIDY